MALTPKQVLDVMRRNGVTPHAWAKANGFSPFLVYRLLEDPKRGTRGQSHRIAVLLGLKEGPANPSTEQATRELARMKSSSTKRYA